MFQGVIATDAAESCASTSAMRRSALYRSHLIALALHLYWHRQFQGGDSSNMLDATRSAESILLAPRSLVLYVVLFPSFKLQYSPLSCGHRLPMATNAAVPTRCRTRSCIRPRRVWLLSTESPSSRLRATSSTHAARVLRNSPHARLYHPPTKEVITLDAGFCMSSNIVGIASQSSRASSFSSRSWSRPDD